MCIYCAISLVVQYQSCIMNFFFLFFFLSIKCIHYVLIERSLLFFFYVGFVIVIGRCIAIFFNDFIGAMFVLLIWYW